MCDRCGHVWEHADSAVEADDAEFRRMHTCPSCRLPALPRGMNEKYKGPRGPVNRQRCNMDQKPRDCCPVCGYQFEEVKELNECPRHKPTESFAPDELIAEDDDYAYCE
jgi:hypothetical protein